VLREANMAHENRLSADGLLAGRRSDMASRCWLCDRPIDDPPRIVGRILAGKKRLAHIECVRWIGEIELGLRAENVGPGSPSPKGQPHPRETPGRP